MGQVLGDNPVQTGIALSCITWNQPGISFKMWLDEVMSHFYHAAWNAVAV